MARSILRARDLPELNRLIGRVRKIADGAPHRTAWPGHGALRAGCGVSYRLLLPPSKLSR